MNAGWPIIRQAVIGWPPEFSPLGGWVRAVHSGKIGGFVDARGEESPQRLGRVEPKHGANIATAQAAAIYADIGRLPAPRIFKDSADLRDFSNGHRLVVPCDPQAVNAVKTEAGLVILQHQTARQHRTLFDNRANSAPLCEFQGNPGRSHAPVEQQLGVGFFFVE